MKHTPGPWYWDSEGLGSKDVLVFGKGYPFEMTSTANRSLIAAAPDLLKELQRLRDYVINVCGVDDGDCDTEHPLMSSRAAISKALGEE